ncbi:MAG: YihY/virulence factor BrkB family protein [Pirellulales bacterium]|nr:YihY/virulence factor BrkB family protein [Pirellulales bacterium]
MRSRILQLFSDFRRTFTRWQDDGGWLMAAATAYYLGISFFPLLLVLIAGLGVFLESTHLGQDAQQRVLDAIAQGASPQLASYVKQALKTVSSKSATSGPLALGGMLIASLAAFAQLDSAFDRVWNAPQKESVGFWRGLLNVLVGRGRAFLLLLSLGAIVVVVFIAGLALSAVAAHSADWLPWGEWTTRAAQSALTIAVNVIIFTLMHKLLPKAQIDWDEALRGGIVTTAGWEIGRQIITHYIARTGYTSAYGVIGAFLSVMLWCYYAVTIVLLGAEWIQVRRERLKEQSGTSPNV